MGVFMMNWDESDERGVCTASTDYQEVERVCRHLEIPCYKANFVKDYWNNVFRYFTPASDCRDILFLRALSEFLEEYRGGRTPNPDVLCNERVKFGVYQHYVREHLGVNGIATGHYARLRRNGRGEGV